jgi:hypothetical protein
MKKCQWVVMACVLAASAALASADFVATYDAYTSSAPYVGAGWTAYQIDAPGSGVATASNWLPMAYNGSNKWYGPNSVYGQPSFMAEGYLTWGGNNGVNYPNAGLGFTAPADGEYSLIGSMEEIWDSQERSTSFYFGTFDGTTYTSLKTVSAVSSSSIDFSSISELQNVTLDAGEQFVMAVVQHGSWFWGSGRVSNIAVGYNVPEPATMAMLVMGGLAILRKRA